MYNTKVSVSLLLNMGPLKLLTNELDRLMNDRLPENVDLEGAQRLLDIAVACNTAIDRLEQAVSATATVSDWRQGLQDIDNAVVYTDDGMTDHGQSIIGGANDFNALHATYAATLTRVRELRESSVELLMGENSSWRGDQVGQLPTLTRHENDGPQGTTDGPTDGQTDGHSRRHSGNSREGGLVGRPEGRVEGHAGRPEGPREEEKNGKHMVTAPVGRKKYSTGGKENGMLDDSAHAADYTCASKEVLGASSAKSFSVEMDDEEGLSSGNAEGRESPISEDDWRGRPSPTSSSLSRVSWPSVTLDDAGDVASRYEAGGRGSEGFDGRSGKDREKEKEMAARRRLLRDAQREYYGTPRSQYLAADATQTQKTQSSTQTPGLTRSLAHTEAQVRIQETGQASSSALGGASNPRPLVRGMLGTSTSASSCWSTDDVSTLTHVTFTDPDDEAEAEAEVKAMAEAMAEAEAEAKAEAKAKTEVVATMTAPAVSAPLPVSVLAPVRVPAPAAVPVVLPAPLSVPLPATLPAPMSALVVLPAIAPGVSVTAPTPAAMAAAAAVKPALPPPLTVGAPGAPTSGSGSGSGSSTAAAADHDIDLEAPPDPEESRDHAHQRYTKVGKALQATRSP